MNCEAVGHLMDDLLDNALSQRERELLEEHLGRCPRCLRELRQRPTFERGIRRALATSVQPLALPSAFSRGLVEAAEKSLRRAHRSQRANNVFRASVAAAALCLLAVGLLLLTGSIPVSDGQQPVTLFPMKQASLTEWAARMDAALDQPIKWVEAEPAPVTPSQVSMIIEPNVMHPNETFTITVFLWSAEAQPPEAVTLDLDVTGPTGYYQFELAVQQPLPSRGVSVLKVTPELLAEPCREQYLMAPTDLFAATGVYDVRVTMTKPASAQRLP
ncbi:MAG TPA: zf-HC2 domain-containing protein [Anaerolineae bacterium]|nr:zf-HC2 domain-containing protein [Anaerolineae bacterium]